MLIKNVNHIKLLKEFDDVGIEYDKQNIGNTMQYDSDNKPLNNTCDLAINFAGDTDMDLVGQVIDAHDPLSSIKDDKNKELNNACNKTVLGRFKATIDGIDYEFSYDYDAQLRFTGIGVMFNAGKLNEIEWTAYQNDERVRITLNQDNFDVVTLAALYHQNYNVTKFNQLLQQVNSATTKEQIEAIVW